jgi:hypothetical protein
VQRQYYTYPQPAQRGEIEKNHNLLPAPRFGAEVAGLSPESAQATELMIDVARLYQYIVAPC